MNDNWTISEKVKRFWFCIFLVAKFHSMFPIEEVQNLDLAVEAVSGAKAIELVGNVISQNGESFVVNMIVKLDKKELIVDGDGDFHILVWGSNGFSEEPYCFFWWFDQLYPIYKDKTPQKTISPDLFSFSKN